MLVQEYVIAGEVSMYNAFLIDETNASRDDLKDLTNFIKVEYASTDPHLLLEILSRAVSSERDSREESRLAEIEVDNENEKELKARASRLEFKIVNETYVSSKSEVRAHAS
ncbi:MAG: hypothetical protein M1813_002312 [Trichoglossum hirsutum]|nr:MAG: hypothetical protein M1813_002312 [Trichoglossum hirsutum]